MIRSQLDVLLDKVQDPDLREDLRTHIDRLKQRRSFGLVFEQHLPERVRLPRHPIRVGAQVVDRGDDDSPTWEVVAIDGDRASLLPSRDADGAYLRRDEHGELELTTATLASLVVISDFGQPIIPGLHPLGTIERGGDKPYHVVIKGENHHALEALQFTHAGKIDCIYIDPPYNSGARDWKYNNDYVDGNDAYRHSKWLAFMERRLKLAKELLNPDDSVLIVTIDENEVHRLGMLVEQVFASARTQMVTVVINPSGVSSSGGLSRVDEYAFFCFVGSAGPSPLTHELLDDRPAGDAKAGAALVRWEWLLRGGGSWYRESRPNLCYPIVLDSSGLAILDVGPPWSGSDEGDRPMELEGSPLAWPVRMDGRLGIWRVEAKRLLELAAKGYAYVSDRSAERGTWTVRYLLGGTVAAIESGEIEVVGRGARGQVLVKNALPSVAIPKTVWKASRHVAGGAGGTQLLTSLLGTRNLFTYPKSLYAVEDSVSIVVKDRPDAVILDFFAGSGTTAHAVARLNKQDGGRRTSIMVTNNEVSVDEATQLRAKGLRPGDPEWEALGIFEHITRPRVEAAITGRTPAGTPIVGDYKFTDEFPMADGFEENAAFFELRYLDADDVDLGLAFDELAPLLWLRAGAEGRIIGQRDADGHPLAFEWTDTYGVLFDEDQWRAFVAARPETARTAFLVTASPTVFAGIVAELPREVTTIRLPDSYLMMFQPDRRID